MKLPNFDGRCSVLPFLAKFDNCAARNKWTDEEKLHYLANSLEDPAAQVLWDMQGCESYKDLRRTLRRIYGSNDQAEVNRSQLKILHRRRVKGSQIWPRRLGN